MEMSSLKVIAGVSIAENTYYTTTERAEILKFIKEDANKYELMALFLDGRIPAVMNESMNKLIEVRFNSIKIDNYIVEVINLMTNKELVSEAITPLANPRAVARVQQSGRNLGKIGGRLSNAAQTTGSMALKNVTRAGSIGAGAINVASPIIGIWAAMRVIKAAINQKKRRCGVFAVGKGRTVCMTKVEIEGATKQLAAMHQIKERCTAETNPNLCIDKIMPKIEEMETTIANLHNKLAALANKGANMTSTPGTMGNTNATRLA